MFLGIRAVLSKELGIEDFLRERAVEGLNFRGDLGEINLDMSSFGIARGVPTLHFRLLGTELALAEALGGL